jgi:hypothetical protein
VSSSTHIFRASLKGRLYRDIEIESDASLAALAEAIVDAFDFDMDHLYGFYSKLTGNIYQSLVKYEGFADADGGRTARSVKRNTVAQAFTDVGSKLMFLYDYGDEWHFKVEVRALGEKDPAGRYPRMLATVGEAPAQYPDLEDDK